MTLITAIQCSKTIILSQRKIQKDYNDNKEERTIYPDIKAGHIYGLVDLYTLTAIDRYRANI